MEGYEANGIDESYRPHFQHALNSGIGYSDRHERDSAKAWRVSTPSHFFCVGRNSLYNSYEKLVENGFEPHIGRHKNDVI